MQRSSEMLINKAIGKLAQMKLEEGARRTAETDGFVGLWRHSLRGHGGVARGLGIHAAREPLVDPLPSGDTF